MTLVGFLRDHLLGETKTSLPEHDPEYKQRMNTLRGAEGRSRPTTGFEKYFGNGGEKHTDHPVTGAAMRKAVASVNAYWGIYGIYREGFFQADNDRLARNPIFAICEKGVMDYLGIVEWEVIDHKETRVERAIEFLKRPNPQDTFPTLLKMTARDIIRYDAGAWVKTLSLPDTSGRQVLLEFKAYSGPEFWVEIDRDWRGITGEMGLVYEGPYSLGYVKRYWQHARAGIFIPFDPKEVVYFCCYPRADSCYGTDFMQQLKWYLEYLIDSTKAAGMTFANGVMPGMKYKHPQYTSVSQLIEANAELNSANLGPENFNGVVNLIGEEDIEPLTPTMVDMQWLEGQMWVAKIVWAMFGFSSSEFVGDDVNRATAYVARNITKSRMLSPLLRKFEEMINENLLPDIEGWEPGWRFRFKDVVDLDDELKMAQIDQARAQVATTYMQLGVPLEAALRIAGLDDEKIERAVSAMEEAQEAAWNQGMEGGGGPMGPPGPGGGLNTNPQGGQQLSPDEAAQFYAEGDEDLGGPQVYNRDNFGSATSQDHEGSDEDRDRVQKAIADEKGHWVTTDEGNHIFISDDGKMRTSPDGEVIGRSIKNESITSTFSNLKTVQNFIQNYRGKPETEWISAAIEKQFDGPNGNIIAYEIYNEKGYTAKPTVVTEQEFNLKIKEGDTETFRGVTHPDHAERLRTGEMYVGSGLTGSGIYAVGAINKNNLHEPLNRAIAYSKGEYGKNKGAVVRIAISKNAKIIDYDKIKTDFRIWHESESDEILKELIRDPGIFAAIKGYDVIRNPHQGCMYYTILNRGAISIQDSDILPIQKKKNKTIQKADDDEYEDHKDFGRVKRVKVSMPEDRIEYAQPGKVPKGAKLYRGPRGGVYYLKSEVPKVSRPEPVKYEDLSKEHQASILPRRPHAPTGGAQGAANYKRDYVPEREDHVTHRSHKGAQGASKHETKWDLRKKGQKKAPVHVGGAVRKGDEETEPDELIEKAEPVYLKPGEEPPNGVKVYEGERGGRFYLERSRHAATLQSPPKQRGNTPLPEREGVDPTKPALGGPGAQRPGDPGGKPSPQDEVGGKPGERYTAEERDQILRKYAKREPGKGVETEIADEDELAIILAHTKFALISAGPNNDEKKLNPMEFDQERYKKRHDELRQALTEKGYVFTQVLGKYGEFEDSFLVMTHDADRDDIVELGKKMNQSTVLFCDHGQNEMIVTRGDNIGAAYTGEGYSWVQPDADEDFTAVYLEGRNGTVNFSLNINFDKERTEDVKKEEEEKKPEYTIDPEKIKQHADAIYKDGRERVDKNYKALKKAVVKNGGAFAGLDFRLKTWNSIHEALEIEHARHPHLPEDQLVQYVDDVTRFTSIISPYTYQETMMKTLADLEGSGVKVEKVSNFWRRGKGCYKGVNVKLLIEGKQVELQFHTPESYEIKQKKTHKWYEVARSRNATREQKNAAKAKIKEIYQSCKYPPRMENWHWDKTK